MLATGLLVCLVAATLLQAPPTVIALAALAACLTKETAYPFVAALGLLGLVLARRRTGRPIRRHVVWGSVGLAIGIVLASLLNVVRFGSVLNTNYLQPELQTHGISRTLDYALALLVAPNGGVFVFWPAASVLLAAACLLPLVFRLGRDLDVRPALVLIAVITGLTLGLASWWDPFGSGYGPRLVLPWILPLVLIALVAYGEPLGELVRRLLAPTWRAPSGLRERPRTCSSARRPNVATGRQPDSAPPRPSCDAPWRVALPSGTHVITGTMELTSDRRPMLVYALEGVGTRGGVLTRISP
jgi:hypothetical protein